MPSPLLLGTMACMCIIQFVCIAFCLLRSRRRKRAHSGELSSHLMQTQLGQARLWNEEADTAVAVAAVALGGPGLGPGDGDPPTEDQSSEASSGVIFDNVTSYRQLEMMQHIGRQEHWWVEAGNLKMDPEPSSADLPGGGGRGNVRHGLLHGTTSCLVKVPKYWGSRSIDKALLDRIANEIRFLRRVRHANVVCFYGVTPFDSDVLCEPCMVLEWIDGCSLREYIGRRRADGTFRKEFGSSGAIHEHSLLVDTARGLHYLHVHGILHRDLKPSNILVDSFPQAKISGFGFSAYATGHSQGQGPVQHRGRYTAPEVWRDEAYSVKSDVFSFGDICIFSLAVRGVREGENEAERAPWACGVDECGHPIHDALEYDGVPGVVLRCVEAEPMCRPQLSDVTRLWAGEGRGGSVAHHT